MAEKLLSKEVWTTGRKLFIVNLIAIAIFAIAFALMSLPALLGLDFVFALLCMYVLILVGVVVSFVLWIRFARRASGTLGNRFLFSLIGSSLFWIVGLLLFLYSVFGNGDFFTMGFLATCAIGLFIFSGICIVLVSLVRKRKI